MSSLSRSPVILFEDIWFKWPGTTLQIAGCALLCLNIPASRYAFLPMFAGAALWLAHGLRVRDLSIVALYVAFEITNFVGIVRWLM